MYQGDSVASDALTRHQKYLIDFYDLLRLYTFEDLSRNAQTYERLSSFQQICPVHYSSTWPRPARSIFSAGSSSMLS